MLRRILVFLIIFYCSSQSVNAQIECFPVFTREYSDITRDIEPYATKYLADGSYVIAGRQRANTNTQYDGMVMKLSAGGGVQWSLSVGGLQEDNITGIVALKNGDFLLYGSTASFGYADEKVWLTRVSGSGSVIWSRQIGAAASGTDRIKAMAELPDNNLIGTFNTNDSTSQSNPVVFKTDAGGTLKWARVFDNGDDESFTSIAFSNDTIYAAGYYTNTSKHGVITKLKSTDGSVISSQSIYNKDKYADQEVMSLEVYNNIISYGLNFYNNNEPAGLILRQTDMDGNDLFSRNVTGYESRIRVVKRSKDNGFFVLREGVPSSPVVNKFNRYGADEWGTQLQAFYLGQKNYSLDTTSDGGCISAGFHSSYYPYFKNVTHIVRMNQTLYSGSCSAGYTGIHSDTGSCETINFTWQNETDISLKIFENINISVQSYNPLVNTLCDTLLCTDRTPLPDGCSKTFRNEYVNDKMSGFKDMLATSDGGKIAVGYLLNDALIVKVDKNSDVVWAKSYDAFAQGSNFYRIIKTFDNNFYVFAYTGYAVTILKINNNGNVLWAKDINIGHIGDVIPTSDNGFVLLLNSIYGFPPIRTYVLRFDANANIIWKKELRHDAANPVYRSVAVGNNAVYIAYDTYDNYNKDKFGVDKLEYATGNKIWSNRYATGTNNMEHVIRMHVINDSVFLFINNLYPMGPFTNSDNIILAKIAPSGKIIQSFTIDPGTILPSEGPYYDGQTPAIVTLTPDFDFVFTSKVISASDTSLNITRFTKDGQKIWSHNFPGMGNYAPWNIHPQADGFLIAGTAAAKSPFYRNSFLLKVDKDGTVIPSATTGDCRYTDNNVTKNNITISKSWDAIDSVINVPDAYITKQNFLTQNVDMDAVPFCSVLGNCGTVGFKQKGNGCSLEDTLTYYLENAANCNAAATWSYDPAYFSAISINGQAIALKPLKNGVSKITADIEGNCSFRQEILNTSVLLSASQINLGNDTIICGKNAVKLSAGPGYKNYRWQDNSTDSIFNATTPGKYYITVIDNCGGTATDTINIKKDASTSFNLTNDTIRCNRDSVLLKASSGYENYQWSPSGSIKAQDSIAYAVPDVPTRYYVEASNKYGCIVKDSVLVTPVSTPPVYLGNDTGFCIGASIVLDAGSGFDKYVWNTGVNTEKITVSAKGAYYIRAYQKSCYSTDTLNVLDVSLKPSFTLGSDTAICPGANLQYNFNLSEATYLWSDGTASNAYTITQPGVYRLTVTQKKCSASDTVSIAAKPAPVVFIGNDTTLCEDNALLLSAYSDNATYKWQDGSTVSVYNVKTAGQYFVAVTKDACTASDTINVQYTPIPFFTLGKDSFLCSGMHLQLEPQMNTPVDYFWQDGTTLPYYTIASPGIYSLKATNRCGYYSDSVIITTALCQLQMPSAFTPNNDGKNDVFRIKYPFPVSKFYMTIYNRFGEKIFESHDISHGWNGTYKGYALVTDTFVWVINLTDTQGKTQSAKGTVTLLR